MAGKAAMLKTSALGGTTRLQPKGDLVASTVEALRDALLKSLEEAEGPVVLDLAASRQVDSLGITLVLGLFKSCQQKGLAFSVEEVNPDIHRVFRLFNLTKIFPVKEAGQ